MFNGRKKNFFVRFFFLPLFKASLICNTFFKLKKETSFHKIFFFFVLPLLFIHSITFFGNFILRLQVLSWFCKKGEDVLTKHGQHAATNLTAARLHEREFEKFYFTSMVSTSVSALIYFF